MAGAIPTRLTLEQAYEAAYLWLFHIDQPPTEVVENPPEMVELYSAELLSWVRASAEVPQKAILAMLQLDDERKKAIFSVAGFSTGAVSIGESHGVALFSLGADGSVQAETGHAIMMMPTQTPPAPFALPPEEEGSAKTWGTTKFDSDVWIDCPECGTNQHVSLDTCRVCGTRLVPDRYSPLSETVYTCQNCGSHDIEVTAESAASSSTTDAKPTNAKHSERP
jgi:hypothetical protein